jgi:Tfp pilus assembly protein PilF
MLSAMRWSRALARVVLASAFLTAACAQRRPAEPPPLGDKDARLERAYAALARKDWKEGVRLLGSVIDEEPENERLRMERGYALYADGQLVAARDEFASVVNRGGEFAAQAGEAIKSVDAESTDAALASRRDGILDEGYKALEQGRKGEAQERFNAALSADPTRVDLHKQLGYMAISDGDMAGAAASLESARRLQPQDYMTALELGYVYAGMNRRAGAEKNFRYALGSPDPEVRRKAENGLISMGAGAECPYLDVNASPFSEARFGNRILLADAVLGCRPSARIPVSAYFAGRFQRDTRTRVGGETPEIYNDNVFSFGPGLRLQPNGMNASLEVEWDSDVNLTRGGEHAGRTESNGRAVLADYAYWEGLFGVRRAFLDLGGSVGWYGRYRDNVIGYAQARTGMKAWERFPLRVNVYAPVYVAKDTNRDFFNNLAEAGGGVEVQLLGGVNLRLRAEALRGFYMGIEGRDPNPYGRVYNDFRLTLIYFGHFSRPPQKDPAWTDDPRPARKPPFRW